MTSACPTCGRCAAPTRRPEGAAALLAPALRALARARRRWQWRRTAARILDLDEHRLADIGLSRTEVVAAARRGRALRRAG